MIDHYFKLECLPTEVREANKIKSNNRFDCTMFTSDYTGINPFINKKGMFFLYLSNANTIVKANQNRMSDFILTGSGLNFTSLYNENDDSKFYGYPNERFKLKDGRLNPLFKYKDDVYLFRINESYTSVEIFIIKNQKGFVSNLYQMFIDGEFDDEVEVLISKAKPFYNY